MEDFYPIWHPGYASTDPRGFKKGKMWLVWKNVSPKIPPKIAQATTWGHKKVFLQAMPILFPHQKWFSEAHENSYRYVIKEIVDFSHCVPLYLIPFEEDASDFLIFWSTHMSKIGGRKKKLKLYNGLCR